MYIEQHMAKWDDLHKNPAAKLKFPSEAVIRFVKGNFRNPAQAHILDLGCGGGRHTIFLAEEGYQVTAIDFAETAMRDIEKLLTDRSLSATLVTQSITSLPFEDESFDGIVSYAVIYYFLKSDIERIVGEIHRTLKPGGKAFIVVRSLEDKRYGQGEEVEPHTYKMLTNFSNEETMLIHFFDEAEIRELFQDFASVDIGFIKESGDSLTSYNADYLITAVK